jgi:hypothetical protein
MDKNAIDFFVGAGFFCASEAFFSGSRYPWRSEMGSWRIITFLSVAFCFFLVRSMAEVP